MGRLVVWVMLLAGGCAMGAPPHRWWVGPTGSDVQALAVGPDGYVWMGAAEGLFRFDGIHLEPMLDCPLRTIKSMVFVGRTLWVANPERLAAFDGQTWKSFVLPEHGVRVATDGASVFVSQGQFWLKFVDGRFVPVRVSNFNTLHFDHLGVGWGIHESRVTSLATDSMQGVTHFRVDERTTLEVARSRSGRLWLFDRHAATPYGVDGKVDRTAEVVKAEASQPRQFVFPGREGRVWFAGHEIRSDPPAQVFATPQGWGDGLAKVLAEGEGGELWLSQPAQGLLRLIPDKTWRVFSLAEFGLLGPTHVTRNEHGDLWAATGAGMRRLRDQWQAAGGVERDYVETLALGDGRMLAASREEGLWILDGEGRPLARVADVLPNSQKDYRRVFRDRRGRIWVGNRRGLLEAVADGAVFRLVPFPLPEAGAFPSPIDLACDGDGNVWVGYSAGLARLNGDGQWERLQTDKPLADVRTVGLSGDGRTIWLGYRKDGYFSRVALGGGRGVVTHFTAEAGYGPKDTYFLRVDSRGWVWRGSRDGVRVSDGVHTEKEDWLHFSDRNGLAGGETSANGFFEDRDGTVWISGGKGMTHVAPAAAWFTTPEGRRPRIKRIDIDGDLHVLPNGGLPVALAERVRKVVVRIGSLSASPFRTQPFRYRLLPGDGEWAAVAADGEIVLDRLERGVYRLEVAFAGSGEAPVTSWDFRVGPERPAYWAYGIGGVGALALLGYLLRRTAPVERLRYRVAKRVHALRHRDLDRGAPDLVGRLLSGRYRVRRLLDVGGMATIYEGEDEGTGGSRVVLKVLDERAAEAQWARRSFSMEVTALRSISHPGVVELLDSWIDEEGRPILVMPFLDGRTLRVVIDAGCGVKDAATILRALGEVLDVIHERGIIHRDVKPENVMVMPGGRVVLLDFGAAGMAGRSQGIVVTEGLAGSLAYMGPERLGGYFSAATDAYSLGVIATELLTGKRPGEGETLLAAPVADIVAELLDPTPEKRPAQLQKWAERLTDSLVSRS